jgi:hypothetical protein
MTADHGTVRFPYRMTCKEFVGWYMTAEDAEHDKTRQGYTGCALDKRDAEGGYLPVACKMGPESHRHSVGKG